MQPKMLKLTLHVCFLIVSMQIKITIIACAIDVSLTYYRDFLSL